MKILDLANSGLPQRLQTPRSVFGGGGGAGGAPPEPFDIADLFTAGSYGLHMSVTDNVMWNDSDAPVAVNSAVQSAFYTKYLGNSEPNSGDRFWNITSANQPILRQDGPVKYLDFDGSNDGLASRSLVDIGTTDAVTVIAGILRDQSTNAEDVLGWTNNPANTNTFVIAPTFDAASNTAGFASRGSGTSSGARASSTLVGTKYVLTGIGDISTDLAEIRRNGAVIQSRTDVDQGSGNYSTNQTLYLGSRGGSARWFNGRVYALVLINRVLSGTELANAEAWVASKTGVTL
jgi:hypothetical protein